MWWSIVLIGLLAPFTANRINAQTPCDPTLAQETADPFGYRKRETRCEGIYIRDVAGSALRVVSLMERSSPTTLDGINPLNLFWSPLRDSTFLRAQSLRQSLYYRMDTRVREAQPSFTWPTHLLNALRLSPAELGLLGWSRMMVGTMPREVLLPLRLDQAPLNPKAPFDLVLQADIELTELFVSVFEVSPAGVPDRMDGKQQLLRGYYPAEAPIRLTIPRPAHPGLYYLEIGATLRDGGSSSQQLWFSTSTP